MYKVRSINNVLIANTGLRKQLVVIVCRVDVVISSVINAEKVLVNVDTIRFIDLLINFKNKPIFINKI